MRDNSKIDEWDEREKNQPRIEIEFTGNHIHHLEDNVCIICGKSKEEIGS